MVDRAKLVGSAQAVATKYHLLTSHWHQLFTISMYLVTRQKLRTACVCLTWILLILQSLKTVSNFDKTDIARNLTLFLYPDDSDRQGELLRIFQQYFMVSMVRNWSLTKQSKKEATCMTLLTTQLYKSTILTHQWWFLNWSVFWLNVASNLMKQFLSFVAWLLTQTTQSLLKPLKNGLLNSWKKWFLTWYQHQRIGPSC